MKIIRRAFEFEWYHGNRGKNLKKHGVTDEECEETFFDTRKKTLRGILHSGKEERYIILGKTKKERFSIILFK